jgi:hypothetical protein
MKGPGEKRMQREHCNKNPIYVFLFWELRVLIFNFHIHVNVSDLYTYSQDRSTYFPAAEQAGRSWKYCV